VACDNTFEPLSDEGMRHTFYGLMDFDADSHYIRINELKKPLLEGDTRPFDGVVTFEHLEIGLSEQLTDSVMVYNGISTHNFLTTIPILPENTYRLTATNSEGRSTSIIHTAVNRYEELTWQPALLSQRTCTAIFSLNFAPVKSGAIILNVFPRSLEGEYQFTVIQSVRENMQSIYFSLDFRDIGRAVSGGDFFYCLNNFLPEVRFEYTHYSNELIPDSHASRKFDIGGTGRFGTLYSGEFELEFNF
jgi:hypothetical protein